MNINLKARCWKTLKRSSLLIILSFLVGMGGASGSPLQELEWQIQVVDAGDETSNDVGEYSSIALDLEGAPYISYYDIGNGDLRFAKWLGEKSASAFTWAVETVDSVGDVGKFSSLAIDANGIAHISYYDDSNNHLKYAQQLEAGGWYTETVDFTGDVGRYSSLALDAEGQPHISYYDGYPNYNLRYAYYDGNQWVLPDDPVDASGKVGQFTSLELDSNGFPHISYFDEDLKAIKYARKTTPPSMPGGWLFRYVEMGQMNSQGVRPRWHLTGTMPRTLPLSSRPVRLHQPSSSIMPIGMKCGSLRLWIYWEVLTVRYP
jgi:hypothetical protein